MAMAALLAGCSSLRPAPADLGDLLPTPLLLVGELHDAPEHQALQRDTVQQLARRGELAALVLEMVEQGRRVSRTGPYVTEAEVRAALDWRDDINAGAWPWSVYGPVVMAAVHSGVPVFGGNLPRERMREVMQETTLDALLSPPELERQREAIRNGHCGLLPETQIAPMTRIQLARDRAMAQTAVDVLQPGRTVLLVAGNGHVLRDIGVPRHLPPGQAFRVVAALSEDAGSALSPTQADRIWVTAARPPRDPCAELRQKAPG